MSVSELIAWIAAAACCGLAAWPAVLLLFVSRKRGDWWLPMAGYGCSTLQAVPAWLPGPMPWAPWAICLASTVLVFAEMGVRLWSMTRSWSDTIGA